jgi:hypothetical protein
MDKEYLYLMDWKITESSGLKYNAFKINRFARLARDRYRIAKFMTPSGSSCIFETVDEQEFTITLADTNVDFSTLATGNQAGFIYLTPPNYTARVGNVEYSLESKYGGGRLLVEVRDQRGVPLSSKLVTLVPFIDSSGLTETTWGAQTSNATIADDTINTDAFGISEFLITFVATAANIATMYLAIRIVGYSDIIVPLCRTYTSVELF